MSTSKGWYDDPNDPEQWRWFDGVQWTGHVRPRQPMVSEPPPPSRPAPPHGVQPPPPSLASMWSRVRSGALAPLGARAELSGADLPPPLRPHVGVPLLIASVGLLGSRTVLLTDHPALYVHDTGGLKGNERTVSLVPYDLEKEEIVFAKASTTLQARMGIPQLGTVSFEHPQVETVADGLTLSGPQDRLTPLPLSVACDFTRADTIEDLVGAMPPDGIAGALREHLDGGELYANVDVADGRLILRKQGIVLCDIPIVRLPIKVVGRSLLIQATVPVAELEARSLTIHLPSDLMMERLTSAIGPASGAGSSPASSGAGPGQPGTSAVEAVDRVQIQGTGLSDLFVNESAEAVLAEDDLTLAVTSGELRFSFDDPSLRAGGSSDRLILFDQRVGPVLVSGVDSHLIRRLAEHEGLRRVAARTLATGPYPCEVAGRPTAVDVDADRITIRSDGEHRSLELAELSHPGLDPALEQVKMTLTSGDDAIELAARAEVMAALHIALQAANIARRFAARTEELLSTIVALEGDYLLYSTVGPVVEVHGLFQAGLDGRSQAPGRPDLGRPIEPPPGEDFIDFSADVVRGAVEAERHLEHVAYQFPLFLTRSDGAITDPDTRPPVELKALESRYRAALTSLRVLGGQLAAVHEPLQNALTLVGVETRKDYSMATITSLAGAVINPVFLISGASQAYAAHKHAGRIESDRLGGAQRMTERSVDRWNHLVATVLPAVSQQVVDGLFPLRWEVAKMISRRHADSDEETARAIEQRLATRLARLETFLAFPPSPGVSHPRRVVVDHLKARMRQLDDHHRFTDF